MKTMIGITFKEENGFFKVPADFVGGFTLVPMNNGKLNLVFCSRCSMRRYLRQHDFKPINKGTKILSLKKEE